MRGQGLGAAWLTFRSPCQYPHLNSFPLRQQEKDKFGNELSASWNTWNAGKVWMFRRSSKGVDVSEERCDQAPLLPPNELRMGVMFSTEIRTLCV